MVQKITPSLLVLLLDAGWIKIRIRDKHPGSATLQVIKRIRISMDTNSKKLLFETGLFPIASVIISTDVSF
jgi:hypothetical protein